MIQDILGTQNRPVMVVAGNLIVISESKFAVYFMCILTGGLQQTFQRAQMLPFSKLSFPIIALSSREVTAHPLCQHAIATKQCLGRSTPSRTSTMCSTICPDLTHITENRAMGAL